MSIEPSHRLSWNSLRTKSSAAPWLNAEQERSLIHAAQRGDRSAMATLCTSHRRLVVQIAARYDSRSLLADDLVSEGTLGLIEAIRRFDCAQQTRLATYASFWIKARIREYAYAQRSIVKPSLTRAGRVVRTQLGRTERTLIGELGRAPTRAELAERLAVPEAEVDAALATALRSNAPLSDEKLLNRNRELSNKDAGPEEQVAEHESRQLLARCVESALAALNERERTIVGAHFLREEASLAELGNTLGITRQRVSQIAYRAREKLARELGTSNF